MGPRPPWGPWSCSMGSRAEAEQGPRAESEAKIRYFY